MVTVTAMAAVTLLAAMGGATALRIQALKKQKLESQGANGGGQTSTATSTQTNSPPNESNQKFDPNSEKQPKKSDIPGTSGNRPPQEYPFPLDPIL